MSICVESALRGKQMLWGAPTYDQTRIAMDETRRACAQAAGFNISTMIATFPSGGRIFYRSLDDADNVRGYTADGVVVDEAGKAKAQAWYEVLRPMLIDTNGWAWIIGTPLGRNWFWQEFEAAKTRKNAMSMQAPTLGVEIVGTQLQRKPHPLENPNIPFEEIENLFHTMPERTFRQEILAEFVEDGGGVFRNVRDAVDVTIDGTPQTDKQYVIGADWGRSNDATVFAVVETQGKRLVYLDRMTDTDYNLQRARLAALARRYNNAPVIAEANAMGLPQIEALQAMDVSVLAFQTSNASKMQIIDGLALAFEAFQISILNDAILLGELLAYESERLASGMIRYSAPDGQHDDCVMALALAWQGVSKTPQGQLFF